MEKWLRTLFVLLLAMSIISSGVALLPRMRAENTHNMVDGALSYADLKNMAQERQTTVEEVARLFEEKAKVNAVLYKEESLKDLADDGRIFIANRQQMMLLGWRENLPFNGGETYIVTADADVKERVKHHLTEKLGGEKMALLPERNGFYAIALDMRPSLVEGIGVGFDRENVAKLENMGFHSVFMLKDWPNVNERGIRFAIKDLTLTGKNISAVLFEKKQVLGYPEYLPVLAEEMNRYRLTLGQVEFYNQRGFDKLATLLDQRVIRMHSVTDEEMQTIEPQELVDRLTLAARERNIRILFLKFLPASDVERRFEINAGYMEKVVTRLKTAGLQLEAGNGTIPRPFEPFHHSPILLFLIGLGPLAGGMLFLEKLGIKRTSILAGLTAIGVLGLALAFFAFPLLARKMVALASVIVFPTLSIICLVPRQALKPWQAVLRMSQMTVFSLMGALMVSGVLADTSFMLKLQQFSGVKVAYLFPVLFVACAFFILYGEGTPGERLKKLMDQPVLVKYLLLAAALAVVGIVYLTRTGNEGAVGVSALELKFRALLDRALGVRPRTKEFLIGHPLMLVLLCLGYRDHRYLPILILASIGQVSMVNTFAHIHTPFIISFVRSINGLILGTMAGLVLIAVFRLCRCLEKRWQDG
ncbi:DUF5693 family protein [Thermosediminibacter oceani]|uniref:Uncharacterized protein n=1 Tax=Thermosediminibacter oceani (strain ATCC BAA-1034 / DSM 16646 / JW/IW-1228P) TaxID=555079 RepID=D9RYL8_THEOJ|nr:DUF5693 family protein [Thermosediminibacter oceani]ADL08442.1 conserved hypothetical protein [Thermosediminibacter oceani DSM 16646]